jgi:hypothetical protein
MEFRREGSPIVLLRIKGKKNELIYYPPKIVEAMVVFQVVEKYLINFLK